MKVGFVWLAFSLAFFLNYTVFCKTINPKRQKDAIVKANKKEIIGDMNLKEYSAKIKPEHCKDEIAACALMVGDVNQTECFLNPTYMKEKCKLTCRFCSPGRRTKKCVDLHPKCALWSKNKDCLHYSAYMKNMCQRSCGLCTPGYRFRDTNVNCPQWGMAGFCNERESMRAVHKECPHSCKKYKHRHFHLYQAVNVQRKHVKAKVKAIIHHAHSKHHNVPHTRPLTEDEKEEVKYAAEEWAEEQQGKAKEKQEQAKIEKEVNMKDNETEKTHEESTKRSSSLLKKTAKN